jgi:magnesium-transporting ATPase (P-type)
VFTTLEQTPSEHWLDNSQNLSVTQEINSSERPVLPNVRQQSWSFQLKTLSKRYLEVIASDKSYVALLAILPLIIAAVGFVVGDDYGLGEGPIEQLLLNPQARSLLLVLILGSTFMGTAGSIQELVKERTIYERERSIGLSRSAYVFSKVIVLGLIVIAQSTVFTIISLAGRPKPSEAILLNSAYLEIILIVSLLGFISMLIGLVISALINSSESAMPALVVVTMSQVILSGAVPIRFSNLLEIVGIPNPAYWAMNAFAATLDLNTLLGYDFMNEISWWMSNAQNWIRSFSALLLFILIFYIAIISLLKKRES